jgi:hypothetical protein
MFPENTTGLLSWPYLYPVAGNGAGGADGVLKLRPVHARTPSSVLDCEIDFQLTLAEETELMVAVRANPA